MNSRRFALVLLVMALELFSTLNHLLEGAVNKLTLHRNHDRFIHLATHDGSRNYFFNWCDFLAQRTSTNIF